MRGCMLGTIVLLCLLAIACATPTEVEEDVQPGDQVDLSAAGGRGDALGVREALSVRQSIRSFTEDPLERDDVADLLWAATGRPDDATAGATRTAPSAGATHPLTVFVAVGESTGISAGLYRYDFDQDKLEQVGAEDVRDAIAGAALGQQVISQAPVSFILVADYDRTTGRYGERGERYVHMEVGYASQNVHLMAEALDLGSVSIGAFDDDEVANILGTRLDPLMIIPAGHPSR